MANRPLTDLTAATTLSDTDLLYLVTDVATTPVSKKITKDDFKESLLAFPETDPETKFLRGDDTWATVSAGTPTAITVANEATDETCFPLFVTAATGDLGPKSNANLTFNSSTGVLGVAGLALGAGSITMTGSLAATDARVTKGWFTDVEITNLPTINGGTLATALSLGTMASETATNYVAKSLFNANTVLYATDDNTPAALEVTEQTLVGRLTGGNISAVAIGIADNNVLQVDDAGAAENDYCKLTTVGVVGRSYSEVLGDIGALGTAGGTMTGNITLGENASIALDPAGSADGKYTGITVTGVAGATVAFGDLITLDKDDSRWELVDISVAAAATGDARGIMGMAVSAGNDGDAITILLNGIIRADANFPALTIGAAVYASTSGDIVVTRPNTTDYVIRLAGYALTADEIMFCPENDWITHT